MPLFLAKELLYSQNEFKRTKWGGRKTKTLKPAKNRRASGQLGFLKMT
jgi:hypothetical protein